MMFLSPKHSVRRKLAVMVGAVTLFALVLNGLAMLVYDAVSYSHAWKADIQAQADVVGRASIPALQFDDPKAAAANLALLGIRPRIYAAAVYDANGALFAKFVRDGISEEIPAKSPTNGDRTEGPRVQGTFPIVSEGRVVGTVLLVARYQLAERFWRYSTIVLGVMALSMIAAALLTLRVQKLITGPILSIAQVARSIRSNRDFALRAPVETEDEIGQLALSFNELLEEVAQRTTELQTADRKKDEFLATLAHELRNPLAPLRNALDIMRMARTPNFPDARGAVEKAEGMMERQLTQLSRLVDDLLDVSRVATGKLQLRREIVALADIVNSAVETIVPLMRLREHHFELAGPVPDVNVFVDGVRLSQVIINLLSNAAKYTPRGGKVVLSCTRDDDSLTIAVRDTGIGIAEEKLAAIFEMFHQVDGTLHRSQAGLGVGLSLALNLAQLHGGTIMVVSDGLGHGSEFSLRLSLKAVLPPDTPTDRLKDDANSDRG